MNSIILKLLILVSIVCLLGVIGDMDRALQAEVEQRQDCQMVAAKMWGQFKIEVNCIENGENYGR